MTREYFIISPKFLSQWLHSLEVVFLLQLHVKECLPLGTEPRAGLGQGLASAREKLF